MNFTEVKTSSQNPDFRLLVAELDAGLTDFYREEQAFYDRQNNVDSIKRVIIIYDNDNPIGCAGIKEYSQSAMEIKRMYVKPAYRGQGIASRILLSLEKWASDLGYSETILETLKAKETVIRMYSKNGYKIIPNYGQYEKMDNSVCMSKRI